MRLYATRKGDALWPDSNESLSELQQLPYDKFLQVEVTQPRNINHHRLYWKLCSRIASGIGKDAEWVSNAFKIEQGYFDWYKYRGIERMVLKSIAFGKMDQTGFAKFFNQCIQIAYEQWKIDPGSLSDLLCPMEEQKRG